MHGVIFQYLKVFYRIIYYISNNNHIFANNELKNFNYETK